VSFPERFTPKGEQLVVSITEAEAELLRSIPNELAPVLRSPADPSDPVSERLFPRAYLDPTEEGAEREWQELVRPELVRERLASLERLTKSLERGQVREGRVEVELDPDEAQAWLGALNDARLALGTRLGVTEDLDYDDVGEDHPDAAAYAVYGWLTWLEGDLVETLLG
jgi:hypothetical protein